MSDVEKRTDAEGRRVSIRLTAEDIARVATLALGDETLSQTVRRVLREAAERAPKRGKRRG